MQNVGNAVETAGVAGQFTATHWSIVHAAQQTDSEAAKAALENLCQRYWYPLYCFLRRGGRGHDDAQDLVQGFIASLLEDDRHRLKQALQPKGKFRTFLLSALKNFSNSEERSKDALRHGGGVTHISLDEMAGAEGRFAKEPATAQTPEEEFDRRYAAEVIRRALLMLTQEYESKRKVELFQALQPWLTEEVLAGFYDQTAPRLNMTPGALKTERNRFKRRFGELVRGEIAHTVAGPQELKDEIRYLFSVWGRLGAKAL